MILNQLLSISIFINFCVSLNFFICASQGGGVNQPWWLSGLDWASILSKRSLDTSVQIPLKAWTKSITCMHGCVGSVVYAYTTSVQLQTVKTWHLRSKWIITGGGRGGGTRLILPPIFLDGINEYSQSS